MESRVTRPPNLRFSLSLSLGAIESDRLKLLAFQDFHLEFLSFSGAKLQLTAATFFFWLITQFAFAKLRLKMTWIPSLKPLNPIFVVRLQSANIPYHLLATHAGSACVRPLSCILRVLPRTNRSLFYVSCQFLYHSVQSKRLFFPPNTGPLIVHTIRRLREKQTNNKVESKTAANSKQRCARLFNILCARSSSFSGCVRLV